MHKNELLWRVGEEAKRIILIRKGEIAFTYLVPPPFDPEEENHAMVKK
jgi:hypothetical protein